jgi:hypothetical protein
MGVAAFWIAVAVIMVAGRWRDKAKAQMRHETVRLLIEKGEPLDGEQIRELLNPTPRPLPANHPWLRPPPPRPSGYKMFRIFGALLMIASPGVAALIAGTSYVQDVGPALAPALGVAAFAFLLGFASFFVSRFLAPGEGAENQGDSR